MNVTIVIGEVAGNRIPRHTIDGPGLEGFDDIGHGGIRDGLVCGAAHRTMHEEFFAERRNALAGKASRLAMD